MPGVTNAMVVFLPLVLLLSAPTSSVGQVTCAATRVGQVNSQDILDAVEEVSSESTQASRAMDSKTSDSVDDLGKGEKEKEMEKEKEKEKDLEKQHVAENASMEQESESTEGLDDVARELDSEFQAACKTEKIQAHGDSGDAGDFGDSKSESLVTQPHGKKSTLGWGSLVPESIKAKVTEYVLGDAKEGLVRKLASMTDDKKLTTWLKVIKMIVSEEDGGALTEDIKALANEALQPGVHQGALFLEFNPPITFHLRNQIELDPVSKMHFGQVHLGEDQEVKQASYRKTLAAFARNIAKVKSSKDDHKKTGPCLNCWFGRRLRGSTVGAKYTKFNQSSSTPLDFPIGETGTKFIDLPFSAQYAYGFLEDNGFRARVFNDVEKTVFGKTTTKVSLAARYGLDILKDLAHAKSKKMQKAFQVNASETFNHIAFFAEMAKAKEKGSEVPALTALIAKAEQIEAMPGKQILLWEQIEAEAMQTTKAEQQALDNRPETEKEQALDALADTLPMLVSELLQHDPFTTSMLQIIQDFVDYLVTNNKQFMDFDFSQKEPTLLQMSQDQGFQQSPALSTPRIGQVGEESLLELEEIDDDSLMLAPDQLEMLDCHSSKIASAMMEQGFAMAGDHSRKGRPSSHRRRKDDCCACEC